MSCQKLTYVYSIAHFLPVPTAEQTQHGTWSLRGIKDILLFFELLKFLYFRDFAKMDLHTQWESGNIQPYLTL